MRPLSIQFSIRCAGEPAAGLNAYTEEVTVTIESGDLGGANAPELVQDFCTHMSNALKEWYDGADVLVNICPKCGGDGWVTGEGSRGEDVQLKCPACAGKGELGVTA